MIFTYLTKLVCLPNVTDYGLNYDLSTLECTILVSHSFAERQSERFRQADGIVCHPLLPQSSGQSIFGFETKRIS